MDQWLKAETLLKTASIIQLVNQTVKKTKYENLQTKEMNCTFGHGTVPVIYANLIFTRFRGYYSHLTTNVKTRLGGHLIISHVNHAKTVRFFFFNCDGILELCTRKSQDIWVVTVWVQKSVIELKSNVFFFFGNIWPWPLSFRLLGRQF